MKEKERPRILIVDDKEANLISLEAILGDMDLEIFKARSGNEALGILLQYDFAVLLLDVQMPDMDGFETATLMRKRKKTKHVPIIFVTAISKDESFVFKGYQAGGVDYISKPLDPTILRSKVKVFVDLDRQRKMILNQNEELKEANRKIREQQEALVEEERLKILLQLTGSAAQELDQPLMSLLEDIRKLYQTEHLPVEARELLTSVQNSGHMISQVVKMFQKLDFNDKIFHDGYASKVPGHTELEVLSLEDSDYFLFLEEIFSSLEHVHLTRAVTMEEAVNLLDQREFDIILMETELPDGTGMDFLNHIKSQSIRIPLIVLTGKGNEQIAANLFRGGACDYIKKNMATREHLISAMNTALAKYRFREEVGNSVQKTIELSRRDQLTGLYNRRYMEEVLEREFHRSNRYGTDLVCLLLDLDFFKKVNDLHGHLCGDYVLTEFASRLKLAVRKTDYLFRYGGEEFLALLPQTPCDGGLSLAQKVRTNCRQIPFEFEGKCLQVTVSIGVSCNHAQNNHAHTLLKQADHALYEAKASGRNCVKIYQAKQLD